MSGGIMAASINAQLDSNCAGELKANARSSETDAGTTANVAIEHRRGAVKPLPSSASTDQATRLVDASTTSHMSARGRAPGTKRRIRRLAEIR